MFGNFNNSRGLNLWHISHTVIDVAKWKNLNSKKLVEEILGWWVILSLFPESLQYSIRYIKIPHYTKGNNMKELLFEDHNFRIVISKRMEGNGSSRLRLPQKPCTVYRISLLFNSSKHLFVGPLASAMMRLSTSFMPSSHCRRCKWNCKKLLQIRSWKHGGVLLSWWFLAMFFFVCQETFCVDVLSRSCKFEFQNFMKRLLNNLKWAK